jgi:hypothetical protein
MIPGLAACGPLARNDTRRIKFRLVMRGLDPRIHRKKK